MSAVVAGRLDGVLLAVVVLLPLAAFEASLALPAAALALRRVRASAERLMEVTASDDDGDADGHGASPTEPTRTMPPGLAVDGLSLRSANIRWPSSQSDALHSIDFDVAVGERVAVVGPSGSGKSTLAAALVRFLPINGGYAVDGRDVTGHGTDVVRARVGLLTQQAHIFDTSLEENLRLAKPDATRDEINDVVRRVRLSEWVAALPRGLQQSMGEGGAAMSGGQRQRIGLARMLLADFDWQVLDEPTENLDLPTADTLMADVFAASGDSGMVLITHRMSDAMRCDRVVVVQEGCVAADGLPSEVAAQSEWFADALALERVAHQWGAFTQDLPAGVVVPLSDVRHLLA